MIPAHSRLSRFCAPKRRPGPTKQPADRAGILRDQIANVEAIRRSYQRGLAGETPSKLPARTLQEGIDRTTARLAALRAELARLTP